MKTVQVILIISVLFLFQSNSHAQTSRSKQIVVLSDTLVLDTLSIVPGSLLVTTIKGDTIPESNYYFDFASTRFYIDKQYRNKYVWLTYRVLPFYFSEHYKHKDTNIIGSYKENSVKAFQLGNGKLSQNDDMFGQDELDKRGSIMRGMSFGNNQDVIVNSNLNLQLSGKIGRDIHIAAAITDNNIPIQPDGNTQQLQEFDKVFIQLNNEKHKLIVGDYELRKPTGYFLNLYKKVQGGQYSVVSEQKNERLIKSTVSGAVAKGKYCRQKMNGQEGNQGPYRLKGCGGEAYIIILAGTEKVYLDGRLLTRGQDNDYVIDYNTAEIVFTPNQMITKDKRIVIEFEYSEKSYARFSVYNSNEIHTKNGSFWLNIYSEQDAKNQPINQSLTQEQKQLLANVGDSVQYAVFPNIKDTLFSNDLVLYKKSDTLLSGGEYYDSIYVYSTNPDSARYKLGFSYVGENSGNYVQKLSAANGKVYKWVAPVDGLPQGTHEPVILLVTPKKKQVVASGGNLKLGKTTGIYYEVSASNNDINTYSSLDRNDNTGYAAKIDLVQDVSVFDTLKRKLFLRAGYEFVNEYFDPVERFKSAEFERDWNLDGVQTADEQKASLLVNFTDKKAGQAEYNMSFLKRGAFYTASKNSVSTHLRNKGTAIVADGSLLFSETPVTQTKFLRHKAKLSQDIAGLTLGVREQLEDNQWSLTASDSLLANSFKFSEWEVFSQNSDSSDVNYFISYKNRKDMLPENNKLLSSTMAQDVKAGLAYSFNPKHSIKTTINYRKLNILDSLLAENEPEENVSARLEYNVTLKKGFLSLSTFYETGSGMEMKKEFTYIEVAQGQGVYSWTDYNGNNVKELDEFEIANFQDQANYIRVFTPTDQYIKIYMNKFSQLVNIRPARLWKNAKGWKKLVSAFSNQFAYRMDRRNSGDDIISSVIPLDGVLPDSSLVSVNSSLRNTFSFNKTSPVFGIDYMYSNNKNRILLVNGIDTRNTILHDIRLRWNLGRMITFVNDFQPGIRTYHSEYFSNKNYEIDLLSNETRLSYQPKNTLRTSIIYSYGSKKNSLATEVCEDHNLAAEVKFNIVRKASLQFRIDYIRIQYNSDMNTPVAYVMLEGFNPGNNASWLLMVQRSISDNLQLSLNYNGRISEGTQAVHTGGVQIRALF